MFPNNSHRQSDHISHKRNKRRNRNIEFIRENAKTNRDIAFYKKHGKEKNTMSQIDYLNKYFIM